VSEVCDCVMLPEIVNGGIPTVDVVLNCQLPVMSWLCVGGPGTGAEEGWTDFTPAPPQPPTTRSNENRNEKLAMLFIPGFIVPPARH